MLNTEQQIASTNIKAFLAKPFTPNDYFTLAGPPGSGKTYMMDHAVEGHHNLQGGTISHSAKNVLSSSFTNAEIECFTVAQLIGMVMVLQSDEMKFKVTPRSRPAIKARHTLILDEVSMINDYLFNKIMNLVNERSVKLIAVGDPFQLPPVGQEHDSRFFSKIDAKLITSMRFGGDIGHLAQQLRTVIEMISLGKDFNPYVLDDTYLTKKISITNDKGYRFQNDIFKVVKRAAREIDRNSDNINHARILAYTNNSVKLLNEGIRSYIYGDNAGQFEFNEIVISNGGFTPNGDPMRVRAIHNGEILRIVDFKRDIGPYNIPVLYLEFDPKLHVAVPVVEDSERGHELYEEALAEKYRMAHEYNQWRELRAFKDSFANFDYAYSTTLHKAQGMTLNKVFVLEGEIMSMTKLNWKQKFQALYVAMTRAKEELIIYNKRRI